MTEMPRIPEQPDLKQPQHDAPVEVEGAPEEEDINEADVAERVEADPEEQENLTASDLTSDEHPEDS